MFFLEADGGIRINKAEAVVVRMPNGSNTRLVFLLNQSKLGISGCWMAHLHVVIQGPKFLSSRAFLCFTPGAPSIISIQLHPFVRTNHTATPNVKKGREKKSRPGRRNGFWWTVSNLCHTLISDSCPPLCPYFHENAIYLLITANAVSAGWDSRRFGDLDLLFFIPCEEVAE